MKQAGQADEEGGEMTQKTKLTAEQEALVVATRRAGFLGAFSFKGVIVPAVEHDCATVWTADGHGAYCRHCGETLA